MQKEGQIGVTTENIFPIIKKFLYSDQEIFLREVVSNAVDASQKLKTYASKGEFKGELDDLSVRVSIDPKAKTLTVSDRGIGMTAEEVDKYINQIAFSSANDFIEKYKDDPNAIIGHFGLGFYSTFMVSKKVEIITKSYKEDAHAVKWLSDGTVEYKMTETDKADRGTDIIMHIDDEHKEFLEKDQIESILKKHCRFLPVPIVSGKKQEWKDGKYVDTEEDNVINNTEPLWKKAPVGLKDEDYTNFYHQLYPMTMDEPMFWIHLNVDYPFHLTGILYFPRVKSNLDLQRNKIQLYSNQVFVTDSVEGIVPEFLTLLHGVIDSPDIPLNVSRSYLQSDSNVKKISNHITKKVSDKLNEIFKNDRSQFEEKWDSLKLFVEYGMLTEEKFYDRAVKYCLFKNTDDKYFTFDEYKSLIESNQKDKNDTLIYLYASNKVDQFAPIESAKQNGYDVLILDGPLDVHWIGLMEQKFEKTRFVRVDSDTIDHIIEKEDSSSIELTDSQKEALNEAFTSQIPKLDKTSFTVEFKALNESERPVQITQNEFTRRMKEMSAMQQGMAMYGEMPDMYQVTVNVNHPLVKQMVTDIDGKEKEAISTYAGENTKLKQIIDLALLSSGMLRGEELNNFVKRGFETI
ncbi:MAG: molecular chaperone HtpG [Dysgonamonadaceae bacterium]